VSGWHTLAKRAVRCPFAALRILLELALEIQCLIHVLRPRGDANQMQELRILGPHVGHLELHDHRRIADLPISVVDVHAEAPCVNPKRVLELVQREATWSVERQIDVHRMFFFGVIAPVRIVPLARHFAANHFGHSCMGTGA